MARARRVARAAGVALGWWFEKVRATVLRLGDLAACLELAIHRALRAMATAGGMRPRQRARAWRRARAATWRAALSLCASEARRGRAERVTSVSARARLWRRAKLPGPPAAHAQTPLPAAPPRALLRSTLCAPLPLRGGAGGAASSSAAVRGAAAASARWRAPAAVVPRQRTSTVPPPAHLSHARRRGASASCAGAQAPCRCARGGSGARGARRLRSGRARARARAGASRAT